LRVSLAAAKEANWLRATGERFPNHGEDTGKVVALKLASAAEELAWSFTSEERPSSAQLRD
jgi:hypothetical protein